jgi:hypothetical protein
MMVLVKIIVVIVKQFKIPFLQISLFIYSMSKIKINEQTWLDKLPLTDYSIWQITLSVITLTLRYPLFSKFVFYFRCDSQHGRVELQHLTQLHLVRRGLRLRHETVRTPSRHSRGQAGLQHRMDRYIWAFL